MAKLKANKHNIEKIFDTAAYIAYSVLQEKDTVLITIDEETRTLDQNAKLHAMLRDIASQVQLTFIGFDESGEPYRYQDKGTIEEWKAMFAGSLDNEVKICEGLNGERITISKKTSLMTNKQLSELIELITAWCATNGVNLKEGKFN